MTLAFDRYNLYSYTSSNSNFAKNHWKEYYETIKFSYNIKDSIDHKENGLLITPFEINDYVKTLTSLISYKELTKKMSIKSIRKSEKFELNIIGNKWIDIINS